jgi:N6-L-threonylcarbamoyladenine synthase
MRVVSNVVASQIPVHARFGGVVPELASRNHLTAIGPVIQQTLQDGNLQLSDLDAIAVTTGPGLAGCLLVGLQTAKALAWSLHLPLIPVNHIAAHVHAVYLKDDQGAGVNPPTGAHIALAVSGGHTSLMKVTAPGKLETLGQTLDDAAGEAFDKVGKLMALPYPGGVHIDRMSDNGDPEAVKLPRPMLKRGLDFSFSGLKTAARNQILDAQGEVRSMSDEEQADLAASLQEAICDVLVEKSVRACVVHGLHDLVVAGGVACNRRLRKLMDLACQRAGIRLHLTPKRYCTDNAAMVGGLGLALLREDAVLHGQSLLSADIHVTRRPQRRSTNP